jgi:hypothetical protein
MAWGQGKEPTLDLARQGTPDGIGAGPASVSEGLY